jgi:hypothetical protein
LSVNIFILNKKLKRKNVKETKQVAFWKLRAIL